MSAKAADPRTLFRPGGRTIGDLMRDVVLPDFVKPDNEAAYRLNAVLAHGTPRSVSRETGAIATRIDKSYL